ncbi:hypothetical protein GYH30_005964 [Glycine max]|uniref:uncharacterized protein LOC114405365 isoform X1 n=1 Tax=Glycine soja TaxID=3848 RepID=UPI00103B5A61|nr:uncharacterized protein LOC114405365 isoform X1 [Glycine soja]KAG5042002.1 hypothetical protein JHK87_005917 [Glycine soja]KAG5070859.1 hypothetical protein JHK86_006070 [Glycine max]KAH1068207.1 hypothetical protein GYH30_005964 [Glycine max]
MPMTKPKPMPEEQKMEYFMQVTEAPLSVAVQKLEKHGGNLNKALEDFYQKDSLRKPSQNEQHRSQKGLTVAEFLEAYPKKTLAELLDESTEGSFSWKKWAAPKIPPSHSQKTEAELLDEGTEGSSSRQKWAVPKIPPSHSPKTLAEFLAEGTEGSSSWKKWAVPKIPPSHSPKTLAEFLAEGTEGSSWKKWAVPKILPSHSQKKQKAKSGQLPMSSSSKGPVKQKAIDPLTRPKFPYARIPADKRWEYLERLWRDYADTRDNIHIAVHIPGGGCVQRIFLKTDKLKELFRFLRVIGLGEYLSESYVLATKSPRRCYSIKDGRSTLDEVGLGNGGDLYLEKI